MPERLARFQVPGAQAGPYRWDFQDPADASGATWFPMGIVESAPEIELQTSHEEVRGDNLGETVQDIINTGANCYVSVVINEFAPYADDGQALSQVWRALFPWYVSSSPDTIANDASALMSVIGQAGLRTVGAMARATIGPYSSTKPDGDYGCYGLMATALNTINSTKPFQVLFRRATVAANSPFTFPMGTRLKSMPIRFQMFPHPHGGDLVGTDVPLRFFEVQNSTPGFSISTPV